MVAPDIAKRVYDHTWKLDPIIRSLLDTDFYKLLMLQMIWGVYPDVRATFSLGEPHHDGCALPMRSTRRSCATSSTTRARCASARRR